MLQLIQKYNSSLALATPYDLEIMTDYYAGQQCDKNDLIYSQKDREKSAERSCDSKITKSDRGT